MRQVERELRSGRKGMSAGLVKRIPLHVHVGKAGDKSVDKRDFLCTKQWIDCGYLSVFIY